MNTTAYVVYCEAHGHYLVHAGVTGTTWRDDQEEAKRYPTKATARVAQRSATWLDHKPIVWAVSRPDVDTV